MYETLTREDVKHIIKEWNRRGGTKDYVGNMERKYIGIDGLMRMVDDYPESAKPREIHIERRLAK